MIIYFERWWTEFERRDVGEDIMIYCIFLSIIFTSPLIEARILKFASVKCKEKRVIVVYFSSYCSSELLWNLQWCLAQTVMKVIGYFSYYGKDFCCLNLFFLFEQEFHVYSLMTNMQRFQFSYLNFRAKMTAASQIT